MALYGSNLSTYIPDGCTWGQADDILGACEQAAQSAYSVFSDWANYQNHGLLDAAKMALFNRLDASQTAQLKSQLDDAQAACLAENELVQEQGNAEGFDTAMPADHVAKVKGIVANMSSMMSTIDAWFSVSLAGALSDSVTGLVGGISGTVANAASKLVGNFFGGTWWIWAGAALLLALSPKLRKVVL